MVGGAVRRGPGSRATLVWSGNARRRSALRSRVFDHPARWVKPPMRNPNVAPKCLLEKPFHLSIPQQAGGTPHPRRPKKAARRRVPFRSTRRRTVSDASEGSPGTRGGRELDCQASSLEAIGTTHFRRQRRRNRRTHGPSPPPRRPLGLSSANRDSADRPYERRRTGIDPAYDNTSFRAALRHENRIMRRFPVTSRRSARRPACPAAPRVPMHPPSWQRDRRRRRPRRPPRDGGCPIARVRRTAACCSRPPCLRSS